MISFLGQINSITGKVTSGCCRSSNTTPSLFLNSVQGWDSPIFYQTSWCMDDYMQKSSLSELESTQCVKGGGGDHP